MEYESRKIFEEDAIGKLEEFLIRFKDSINSHRPVEGATVGYLVNGDGLFWSDEHDPTISSELNTFFSVLVYLRTSQILSVDIGRSANAFMVKFRAVCAGSAFCLASRFHSRNADIFKQKRNEAISAVESDFPSIFNDKM